MSAETLPLAQATQVAPVALPFAPAPHRPTRTLHLADGLEDSLSGDLAVSKSLSCYDSQQESAHPIGNPVAHR